MPANGESAFTEAEITESLMSVVAWAGNVQAACRALRAKDGHYPSEKTLYKWVRETHVERFDELRTKHAEKLEANLVNELRENARLALDVERRALQKALGRLESGADKDPSRTAANAATVTDKNVGKMLALQGRPTSIQEVRTLSEVLRGLAAKKIISLPPEEEPRELPGPASR